MSVIQRLNPSLSMNCLNSSASSFMTDVMTRSNARSCSILAFCSSEFRRALRNALSSATREGIVSVMSCRTRSRFQERVEDRPGI